GAALRSRRRKLGLVPDLRLRAGELHLHILPEWLIHVAEALPSALVFEGMWSVMFDGVFRQDLFWRALGLNAIYMALAIVAFMAFIRSA
ncbi:MAG: hypothetical protein VCD31_02745, partial [Alphaproteobacteria bacterium]